MTGQESAESDKPNADDWRNIECWVDDDFDANELLRDLGQTGHGAGNEDDWDDWSGEEEERAGRAAEPAKGEEFSWNRGKPAPADRAKRSSRGEKVPRRRHSRGEESRREREKAAAAAAVARGSERPRSERSHEQHRRGGRRHAKEEPDLFPLSRKDKKVDEMSSAFARLMPVEGWKPAVPVQAEPEEDYEEHDDVVEPSSQHGGLQNVHSQRQRLIQAETPEEEPRSRRRRSRHRKRSSRNKSKSPEPSGGENGHPVRIHYTDGAAHPAAELKGRQGHHAGAGEAKSKKKPVLESRWAKPAAESKHDNDDDNSTTHTREQHRQKKIASQLDWDKGVKGTAEDDNSHHKHTHPAKETPRAPRHEHFSYENSERPASVEEVPKASKPKPKLASMWA